MPRSRFSDLLPSMLLLLRPQGHPEADPPLGAGRQLPGTSWPTLGRYRALLLALIVVLWSFAQRACPQKKCQRDLEPRGVCLAGVELLLHLPAGGRSRDTRTARPPFDSLRIFSLHLSRLP